MTPLRQQLIQELVLRGMSDRTQEASIHQVYQPFAGPEQVLAYLSRYTHRVAIGNRRLLAADEQSVTFSDKDYADEARRKTMRLSVEEFVRRFCLHLLPERFVKIRHYGLLGNRNLIPLRARRTVEKLLKSKTQHDPRALEDPKYGTVACGVDGLRITSGKGDPSQLQWSEVEEVHACKRDLFATDLICLAFKKSGTEEYYEVHEEMAGYHDLLEVLQSRLPRFTLEWIIDVAIPAFETRHQIIWKRSPNQTVQATAAAPGS